MDGVHEKLTAGARVADVGCGYGASTVILASAYPDSTFTGYDYHEPSVRSARERASQARVSDRLSFQAANATDITGPYDLIAFFDCWHDTADPLGVATAARQALADAGSVLLVEPAAGDQIEDIPRLFGRMFYGASASCASRARSATAAPASARRPARHRPRTVRQARLRHLPPCRADPSERGLPGQRLGERHAGLVFPPRTSPARDATKHDQAGRP